MIRRVLLISIGLFLLPTIVFALCKNNKQNIFCFVCEQSSYMIPVEYGGVLIDSTPKYWVLGERKKTGHLLLVIHANIGKEKLTKLLNENIKNVPDFENGSTTLIFNKDTHSLGEIFSILRKKFGWVFNRRFIYSWSP